MSVQVQINKTISYELDIENINNKKKINCFFSCFTLKMQTFQFIEFHFLVEFDPSSG